MFADVSSANVVGYATKAQAKASLTSPTGIITFQWDKTDGSQKYLNDVIKPSVMGTAFNHGEEEEATPGWTDNAPYIQVREASGGYARRWYADDAWDDDKEESVPGWADDEGVLDVETTIALGQGAWVQDAAEDCVFTVCGAVATKETAVGGDSSGATILAGGAFPVAFMLNGENVTWTCTPGTAFNHGVEEEATDGWTDNAPYIQVREVSGGYARRWYADDAWDEDKEESVQGWADDEGILDVETTVAVGGGFWMMTPIKDAETGKQNIFVTVANPIKK